MDIKQKGGGGGDFRMPIQTIGVQVRDRQTESICRWPLNIFPRFFSGRNIFSKTMLGSPNQPIRIYLPSPIS